MAFSKLISRLKKAFGIKCAHEPPREPLASTGNTAENHRHPITDDPPVVARNQAERQKKSSLFKACFPRRAAVDDPLPALEIHDLQDEPISSSKFFHTAVNNLELEVLQPSIPDAPAEEDLDSTVKSEVNSFESPVSQQFSTDGIFEAFSGDSVQVDIDSALDEDSESSLNQKVSQDDSADDSALSLTADDETCLDNNDISSRYNLGKQLGEGGFGSVFEGIRIQDGLQVAVKFAQMTPRMRDLCSSHDQPPLEITLASMASSGSRCANIIQLLDWQVFKDHYVMVMERPTPSMDLEAFLQLNEGVLTEQTAQTIMGQAVHAANICCYRGVFHRDIKLQNLLVNPNTLEVKLIDFGCGDYMMESAYSTFSGTKAYMPPEFYKRGCYHAKPATVYSLGVLLFTMLHGDFPTTYDLYYLEHDWSKFTLSQECCDLMWACLQQIPEHRILLGQMPYHDWFMLE
nr:serine/threonine-protein kinase pim-1-like isoform X2 [Danio rerio]|eukprot:XP_021327757.1 serine/threonine-protein kinase pim-1-like isoform X2 [Danio rerio]